MLKHELFWLKIIKIYKLIAIAKRCWKKPHLQGRSVCRWPTATSSMSSPILITSASMGKQFQGTTLISISF